MVLELEQFQRPNLQAFIEAVPNNNQYRLASAFPDERVYDDKFIYDIIKRTPVIAAKVTGFDSSAPIRGMAQAEQALGRLTKIQDAYFIDESTDRAIAMPRRGTDEDRNAIRNALKDVGNLKLGVQETIEYLRAKLVYDGALEYVDPFSETKVSFEVDRPEGNNVAVATKWDDPTANPFADLKAAVKQYQTATNSKKKPERIDIAQDVEDAMLESPSVKLAVYGKPDDARMVDSEQLQALFRRHKLPQYFVNEDSVTFEDIVDGERTTVTRDLLDSGKVVLYDNIMGSTARGQVKTSDGTYQFGIATDPIVVPDPVHEKIIVMEAAIPALKAVNNNVIMTVL
ncbi:major capsid protein [Salinicoccus sp. ID82-1]|uniref:major capsid protein n=1 Tax=Salinicoccus sp. ID82-1 TaxID=2820269 RepID=UPI001F4505E9|nr:major capsid protein [Salinicoccus sp. ID82-1]MCG1009229.1 major capsid protein [Salinicoccus sp. ID82-1]